MAVSPSQIPVAGDAQRDPLECLAEEFLDRRRHGADVSIDDYAAGHPDLAERIRDLFPALVLLEELKPGDAASGGGLPARGEAIEQLGDFHVVREIGRGGMGVVYEAVQESLGRRVALKVLPRNCVASGNRLRRFLREAQAAARLHHTNIVPVFGVGEQDGLRYYVMQFIPGQGLDRVLGTLNRLSAGTTPAGSLAAPAGGSGAAGDASPTADWVGSTDAISASEAVRRLLGAPKGPETAANGGGPAGGDAAAASIPAGPPYWRSVAQIGVQVAEALEYAHRQGVLHRDIKPANLLLDDAGTVWIADFGLAKLSDVDDLTHPNDTLGTLRYMAPEQFAGKFDARSDVYSLGLTLYELLVLRPAFDESDRRRLIRQVAEAQPPRPGKLRAGIPRDLETIVVKATASQPEHRYQTAGDLAADLRAFLEDRPIRARQATPIGRLWRWCRRNRAVAALSGAALALLITVAVVASFGYLHTSRALQQAEAERVQTKAQRERAENNLHLATKAFEDIFGMVASDPIAQAADEDDEDWPGPAAEPAVSDKDAALLESLLKFWDQFAEQNQADVKLQKETARAYRRVGDIQRHLGQYDKAETAYRHALATYAGLAATPPPSAECLTSTAAIHNELGVLFHDMGRLPEARDFHRQALEILQKEPADAAALPESRFELARTLSALSTPLMGPMGPGPQRKAGSVGGRRGWASPAERLREPSENNRRALEILAALSRDAPDNPRYRLAMARSQRDRYLLAMVGGQRQEAAQAKQEAIRILKKLVEEAPQIPAYRSELAETYAMVDFRSRDKETAAAAVPPLRQAVEMAADLVARWPAVPAYKVILAQCYGRLAAAARSAVLTADAQDAAAKAVTLQKALAAEFPKIASYRLILARSLQQQAEIATAAGQPAQARASLEAAIAELEKPDGVAAAGPPRSRMLAGAYAALAKVLRELGEDALADAAAAKSGEAFSHPLRPRRGGGRPDGNAKRP
jgi:tetratricopeptide (TPR) repeat protein